MTTLEKPIAEKQQLSTASIRSKVQRLIALTEPLEKLQSEFDELKKEIIQIAQNDSERITETESGGTTWLFPDGNGRNVRVVFPIDQLQSLPYGEEETESVKETAGASFKKLFVLVKVYKPIETGKAFRTLIHALLGGRSADRVLGEISKPSAPRLSIITDKAQ